MLYTKMDAFTLLETTEIKCLDHGFVKLVDCMPRLIPQGTNCESAIVKSARVSTGTGLKTPLEDSRLVRYLYNNYHSSPFESVKFSFHIRAPIAVRTHFIRHRTANVNEFSQRYAPLNKISTTDNVYYRPSKNLRKQGTINKQSSEKAEFSNEVVEVAEKCEKLCDEIYKLYERLLELGVSREVARFYLPSMTYTEFFFTMDLNNLLKFLMLRNDPHTQEETRVFAEAIENLVKPLVPNVICCLQSNKEGIRFSGNELSYIENEERDLSSREKLELKIKVEKILKRNI